MTDQILDNRSGPSMQRVNWIEAVPGKLRHPLAKASIMSLLVYVAGAAASFLSQVVIARSVGRDSFGIYAYVMAWVTLFGYLTTLGFHLSLMRFVPTYRTLEKWPLARGVIQFSQRSAAVAGLSITAAGIAVAYIFRDQMGQEQAITFALGALTVPFICLHLLNSAIVRCFGGVVSAVAPERLVRDTVLVSIVAICAWSGLVHSDARLAMAASLVSMLATLLVLKYYHRKLRPQEILNSRAEYLAKEWYKPALPLMISVIADNLLNRAGIIILGLDNKTVEAGLFSVALGMSLLTSIPRMAVATAFVPQVAEFIAREDHDGLQAIVGKASGLSTLGSLTAAIPLLILNAYLLSFFGKGFADAAPLVAILTFGQVFSALFGPQQHIINMSGNERHGSTMFAVCVALNVVVCYLTVRSYGTIAVALAMSSTMVLWNLWMSAFIYRKLNIIPGIIHIAKMAWR